MWLPQVKSRTTRPPSAGNVPPVDTASCSCQTSDESQLNNERLDDIAFENHIMESVYRKGSDEHL